MIYLMRHGDRKTQNSELFELETPTDSKKLKKHYTRLKKIVEHDPLTREGKKLVAKTVDEIKKLNIDIIITSPYTRCMQTTKIISRQLHMPVVIEPRLIDRTHYYFISHIEEDEYNIIWDNYLNYDFTTNKIEDCHDFIDRVKDALDDITTKYQDKNVLIVGHSCLSYAFNTYFYGMPKDHMIPHDRMDSCEIRKYK